MSAFLEIAALAKVFPSRNGGGAVAALHEVDLAVEEGEFVCLVGPSGCGKSTLLNVVAGLEEASAGSVRVNGREISGAGADRGMVFQEAALFPWLNVIQNIEFPLRRLGVARAERRDRALHFLRMVHLSKFAAAYVHELSGGMRQRVAIARALALDPEVVICDEAVSALDVLVQAQILTLLNELQSELGLSYLFITHDLAVVRQIADNVLVMQNGKVVEQSTVSEVFENPREDYTRMLLDAIPGGSIPLGVVEAGDDV